MRRQIRAAIVACVLGLLGGILVAPAADATASTTTATYGGEVFHAPPDPTSPPARSTNCCNYWLNNSTQDFTDRTLHVDHRADGLYASGTYDLNLPPGYKTSSLFDWDRAEAFDLLAWDCVTAAARTSSLNPWVYQYKLRYNTRYTIILDSRWDWQLKWYQGNSSVCTG